MALGVDVLLASVKVRLVRQDRELVALGVEDDVELGSTDSFLKRGNGEKCDLTHDKRFLELMMKDALDIRGYAELQKGWGDL